MSHRAVIELTEGLTDSQKVALLSSALSESMTSLSKTDRAEVVESAELYREKLPKNDG